MSSTPFLNCPIVDDEEQHNWEDKSYAILDHILPIINFNYKNYDINLCIDVLGETQWKWLHQGKTHNSFLHIYRKLLNAQTGYFYLLHHFLLDSPYRFPMKAVYFSLTWNCKHLLRRLQCVWDYWYRYALDLYTHYKSCSSFSVSYVN